MASDIESGGVPTVQPDTLSLAAVADVWFQYLVANNGDEDDTTTGVYMTVEDSAGTFVHSDYAPDASLPAGETVAQGIKIEGSVFADVTPGDFWVSLRAPSGDTMSAALLTVTE